MSLREVSVDSLMCIVIIVGGMALGLSSDLGKRKNRWEEEAGGAVAGGPGRTAFML